MSTFPDYPRDADLMKALAHVIDPELHIPITEMGLIYAAQRTGKTSARVVMTLTTIGCPLFDVIQDDILSNLKTHAAIDDVDLELTFDPPWSVEFLSEDAQIELGMI